MESVVAGVSWTFNGWGGKFSPWNKDAKVARSILDIEGVPCFECDFVLEGGSVGTDGAGTLLVTESCLLKKIGTQTIRRKASSKCYSND